MGMGLKRLTEGQGLTGRCIPRHRQSGRRQKSSGGLKGCRNVEGFRSKQQEATWSSGQGLSHPPPPLKGPPPLSPPSPGLPPLLPRTKAVLFFLPSLPCGRLCATQTPWPHLPHLFWGSCLNRQESQGWNSSWNHLEQARPCSERRLRTEESQALPRASEAQLSPLSYFIHSQWT